MASHVRAERTVMWTREPEMSAWMLAHDCGRPTSEISADFREVFGFGLNQSQISAFRSAHGTQTVRRGRYVSDYGSKTGQVRKGKNGYLVYRFKELPDVPGSKDNWHSMHRDIYEAWYGPVPDDCVVMFADGDINNFDPYNLVAVPRRFSAQLRNFEYFDRETLELAVIQCELQSKILEKRFEPRRCAICGKLFDPKDAPGHRTKPNKCCNDCIAGRKHFSTRFSKADKGEATCPICGRSFLKRTIRQRRCEECIAEHPHHSVAVLVARKMREAAGPVS